MKGSIRAGTLGLALFLGAALGFGQTNSATFSAPPQSSQPVYNSAPAGNQSGMAVPGTVNYVEGQVFIDNQTLNAGARVVLQPGQTLATGDNGFAEVLLTPGAFLRVGHDSNVHLNASGLAGTNVQLDRGGAMVEVDQLIKGTNLAVTMNGATAQLKKKGLYDFNAAQQTVMVLDGKADVRGATGNKTIGKGDELQLADANPLKSRSFDRKTVKSDPLYVWSEARSQYESQANVSLAENVAAYGGWYGPGWYWDPYSSFYAYLPGDGLLYSPFGWGFYSPAFIGYYGVPYGSGRNYGHFGGWHGRVGGVSAFHGGAVGGVHSGAPAGGFRGGAVGGGFHGGSAGGGFHGGGFHGGGRR